MAIFGAFHFSGPSTSGHAYGENERSKVYTPPEPFRPVDPPFPVRITRGFSPKVTAFNHLSQAAINWGSGIYLPKFHKPYLRSSPRSVQLTNTKSARGYSDRTYVPSVFVPWSPPTKSY